LIRITEKPKVVIKITESFLDTIDILLNLQVGDLSRLEHVKRMILENKPLYTSDEKYVESLAEIYIKDHQTKEIESPKLINCRNCSTSITEDAKFCTLCGTRQERTFQNYNVTKIVKKYNPLQFISKPNSYQSLTIFGGLMVMIPVLFIVARIEPFLDAINYETGSNLSGLVAVFISLGIISSILSTIAIAITFLVKNPKKVGRMLFFIAFAILITSILIGIVGFVVILISSNVAFKKRHY
jgi:hypothetical protein